MADTPESLSTLLAGIERLLLQDEPDSMLETCYFSVRFGRDTGHLVLRILPTVEQATFDVRVRRESIRCAKVEFVCAATRRDCQRLQDATV
jgi:hypothetical protein